MQSYRELRVYQESYIQAMEIYRLTEKFPKTEQYGLTSQIRRAATSIPLNIAEGYGKLETGHEVLRFLSMARGSSAEMEVLLSFSKDLGYLSENEYSEFIARQEQVGKMLTGLIKSIRSKS